MTLLIADALMEIYLFVDTSLFRLFNLVAVVAPLVVGSSVYEACPEGGEDKVVTLLQLVLVFPEGKRNGGGRRVAEVLDVYHHLVHRQIKTLCNSLDNTDIRLVRNNETDVVLIQIITLCNKSAVIAHACHSITEDSTTLLI